MKDYLEHLRAKSEESRKRIALGAAAAVTGVVALGWIIALVSSGSLAVNSSAPTSETEAPFAESGERYRELAGAASALYGAADGEGQITIVEEERSSTLDRNDAPEEEATVIHF